MSEFTGTSVGHSNTLLRVLGVALVLVCGIGIYAYTNGVAAYEQPIDFSGAKHIPTHSGTQATPNPLFSGFVSPLTAAYITGETQYPPDGTPGTGLYVCAVTLDVSSLHCSHPDEFKPLADGSFNFSLTVPPGTYYVYSAVPGTQYEAFYDSSVDGSLIPIVVRARQVVNNVAPVDWSAP
jgi:hypothetical protein